MEERTTVCHPRGGLRPTMVWDLSCGPEVGWQLQKTFEKPRIRIVESYPRHFAQDKRDLNTTQCIESNTNTVIFCIQGDLG